MKNLKKVLSLVLALAMALSLMTVAFAKDASDYADYDEVTYKEAVDVMTAIGVFDGMNGTEFAPDGTLTREQAAKIICYMLMGQEKADKLTASKAPFADVAADRWSAGAIAYCASEGIVDGVGNNKFNPTGTLTGQQFAKMVLVALGFDAQEYGLIGESWAINASKLAISEDLDKDMEDINLSNNMTREQACQMALNAVKHTTSEDVYAVDDNGKVVTFDNLNDALLYVAIKDSNTVQYIGKTKDYSDSLLDKVFEVSVDDGVDSFGRPAATYINKDWDDDMVYANEADYTVVVDEANKDAAYWAEEANKNLTGAGTGVKLNNGTLDSYQIGDVIEFYVDNKAITNTIVSRYTADVITDVDTDVKASDAENGVSAYITFENAGKFNDTEIPGYNAKTFTEDAVVALAMDGNDILNAYVTDSVKGAITAQSEKDNVYTYTMNGTKYTMVASASKSDNNEIKDKVDFEEGNYKLYLDQNGYVLKAEILEGTAAIGDVFYLEDVDQNNVYWVETENNKGKTVNAYYVQAVALDGTVTNIKIAEATNGTDEDTAIKGYLDALTAGFYTDEEHAVTYSGNKTSDVTLTKWSNDDYSVSADLATGSSLEIKSDTKSLDGYYLNSNTQYVVVEKYAGDVTVTVKTGSISYKEAANDQVYVIGSDSNGSKVADYVIISSATYTASVSRDYIYVADADYDNVSGGKQYTVYNKEGKEVTIVVDKDSTVKNLSKGNFYNYAELANGNYDIKDNNVSGQVMGAEYVSYYGDLLTADEDSKIKDFDTSNAVIVDAHDTDAEYSKSVTSLSAMQSAKKAGYIVTFDAIVDSTDEEVDFIVVTSVKSSSDTVADAISGGSADVNGKFNVTPVIDGNDVTFTTPSDYTSIEKEDLDGGVTQISGDLARYLGALHNVAGASEIVYNGNTYKWCEEKGLESSNWTLNGENSANTLVKAITDDWKDGGDWKTGVTYKATLMVDGIRMTYTVNVGK